MLRAHLGDADARLPRSSSRVSRASEVHALARGVEHARELGMRVLSSRPVEAERGLALVGLGDLFEDVVDEVLPPLPAPRRRALEVALLLEDADADGVDPRALGIATSARCRLLAGDGPRAGRGRRRPVARRLVGRRARVRAAAPGRERRAAAARPAARRGRPSALERALDAGASGGSRWGRSASGALHRFLRDRLGRVFARQTLLRIHERSGGNPFYALELARVLDETSTRRGRCRFRRRSRSSCGRRISGLPAAARDALEFASALGTPSESLLERAGVGPDGLERRSPPASSSARTGPSGSPTRCCRRCSTATSGDRRRRVHRRIAGLVDDPLARARHLALSTERPDAEVASVLDDAARMAADRGAAAAAAELAEHALRLTTGDAHTNAVAGGSPPARAQSAAGEWTRARTIAADLLADWEIGAWRAEAHLLLAELKSVERAVPLLEEALREAAARPALQSMIHCRLAWATRFRTGTRRRSSTPGPRCRSPTGSATTCSAGRPARWTPCSVGSSASPPSGACRCGRTTSPSPSAASGGCRRRRWPSSTPSRRRHGGTRRARSSSASTGNGASARAAERPCPVGLAWVELWDGRWGLAAEHAARAHDIAIQYGLETPQDHLPIAVVAVHRGRLERPANTRSGASSSPRSSSASTRRSTPLCSGSPRCGAAICARRNMARGGEEQAVTLGWGEPSVRWWTADHVELLLELERTEGAVRDPRRLGGGRRAGRPRLGARDVARCRGLVAAAEGEVDRAAALLEQASCPRGRRRLVRTGPRAAGPRRRPQA